jgi:tetratricopeptide (TPR) repeat protein
VRRLALLLVLLLAHPAVAGKPSYGDYMKASRALNESRIDDAAAEIAELEARAPDAPEVVYLAAQLAFMRGDYARARKLLDKLGGKPARGLGDDLGPLVDGTLSATKGMVSRTSPGGHFVFFYQPGKDEALIELAGEALDLAWERVGDDLGWKPTQPVRVEIFPRASDLAKVSTLPLKAIETTGTIALSKYGKLMVVSPRGTLMGYPWIDTLVHEYVHLVVSNASADKCPVWLQEGLAKFEETRWRALPGEIGLDRTGQHLLASALKKGRLVTFEEMYPSMALLPTPEAAGTAYAEVHTFVTYVHGKGGYPALRLILAKLKDDKGDKRAIAEVMGDRWEAVETAWRKYLKALPLKLSPQVASHGIKKIKIKKGGAEPDDNTGIDAIPEEKARKLARLGGLLRARGQLRAAAVEYEKALAIIGPGGDPLLSSRLARTYLDLGQPDKAIAVLTALPDLEPDDAGPHTTLGVAYQATGNMVEAENHLLLAVRVQPFDPAVRCGLADIYGVTGRTALATRESFACALVKGGK